MTHVLLAAAVLMLAGVAQSAARPLRQPRVTSLRVAQ
jgi:hypothetical protein